MYPYTAAAIRLRFRVGAGCVNNVYIITTVKSITDLWKIKHLKGSANTRDTSKFQRVITEYVGTVIALCTYDRATDETINRTELPR